MNSEIHWITEGTVTERSDRARLGHRVHGGQNLDVSLNVCFRTRLRIKSNERVLASRCLCVGALVAYGAAEGG
jgi:hypothetical protein